jgi:hypothetical protein
MNQIVVFRRGDLTVEDRDRLESAGVVAVESDDPLTVVTVLPITPTITGNDLFDAAMKALNHPHSSINAKAAFFTHLAERHAAPKAEEGEG